jgi:hypothetical protein
VNPYADVPSKRATNSRANITAKGARQRPAQTVQRSLIRKLLFFFSNEKHLKKEGNGSNHGLVPLRESGEVCAGLLHVYVSGFNHGLGFLTFWDFLGKYNWIDT